MFGYLFSKYHFRSDLILTVTLFLLSFLSCCVISRQATKENWQTSKQLWEGKQFLNYKFSLKVNCFCGAAGASPVSIEVREGVVISIIKLRTSETVKYSFFSEYETIPKLFSLIEHNLGEQMNSFCVEYDASLGYPKKISIDRRRDTTDDELEIEVSNFEVLQ